MNTTPIKVLLVEDNPGDARLVREMLAEVDSDRFDLIHVERLDKALRTLDDEGFDVLLLDLALPDAHGLNALNGIQLVKPSLPIVVLSGLHDEDLAFETVQSGAQDYLVKGQGDGALLVRALRHAIERKRSQERLAFLAHYDPLTGLPNRALFRDRLSRALARAQRRQQLLALMFLDLDHFKEINDTLGHDAGDQLLQVVAGRLKQCLRNGDTAARLGGDEFTIILEEISSRQDAGVVAEKIGAAVSRPLSLNVHDVVITPSIGIAIYPDSAEDLETLIKNADTALYAAKEKGRSTYQYYEAEMNLAVAKRASMVTGLRRAAERQEFALHYQPQLEAVTGRIVGVEALLRWERPGFGLVPAANFIPLLEETGLIIPVGEWVLHTACAQNRTWQNAGLPPLRMAVNLSARQFRQTRLVDSLARILEDTGIEARYLRLEIIENLLLGDSEANRAKLRALNALGVQLVIDNFGAGHSSLSSLRELPLDALKLDRSFIHGIATDPDGAGIVTALINLAHSLRLSVIAEGVETPEQAAFSQAQGCEELQGDLFSRPMPVDACEQWLRGDDGLSGEILGRLR